jgi:hypothetical protein
MSQTSIAAPNEFLAWAHAQRRWVQCGAALCSALVTGCLLTSDPLYCDDITPCSTEQSCLRPEQQCVAIVPFSVVVSDLNQRCGGGTASCHATGTTSRLTVGASQTRDGLQATLTQLLSVPGLIDRTTPASSQLLLRPLQLHPATGISPPLNVRFFADENDTTYQRWLLWIRQGASLGIK